MKTTVTLLVLMASFSSLAVEWTAAIPTKEQIRSLAQTNDLKEKHFQQRLSALNNMAGCNSANSRLATIVACENAVKASNLNLKDIKAMQVEFISERSSDAEVYIEHKSGKVDRFVVSSRDDIPKPPRY